MYFLLEKGISIAMLVYQSVVELNTKRKYCCGFFCFKIYLFHFQSLSTIWTI